jgi:nitrous oxidase accessory protein
VVLSVDVPPAKAGTITVPDDYLTIQEAVNAANDGDTIFVRNGTYVENVVVNKTVSLIGEDRDNTIVDGNSIGNVVSIIANNVSVTGFTVQNCATAYMSGGIHTSSLGNNISHNVVKNSLAIPDACGIWLDNSSHNTVYDNIVFSNGLAGIYLEDSNNNTISYNDVFSNPYEGIFLVSSDNNVLTSNEVSLNMDTGIYLMASENNTISSNYAIENGNGIFLEGSNHNMVCNNNASLRNTQSPAAGLGITLRHASDNIVSGNIALNNTLGMNVCFGSYGNIITDNTFSSNNYGIELAVDVVNNTVCGNTVSKNNYGISFVDGGGCMFFHNNFIENIRNTHVTSLCIWDNGCEGNFWSNYNGTDLDDDGIGDTYVPWEGVDNYPLMNLYWNPADIDHDLDVDMFDVVRCANAYSSTPSSQNWNPHCDINELYGIVNIFDVVLIAASYGEEYTP